MHERAKAAANDPAHKTDTALNDYAALVEAVVTPITVAQTQGDAMLAELLQRSEASGKADTLRDEGITEKAIIRLAQRIAADTDDVGQAWLELQNAMDIAVRVQAEGQVQSNHGDFVDTVLARVAELAKDGDYTAAGAAIDDALDQADAQISRLLTSGVEVALLDRDTTKAAALLVRKADSDAGGMANFETLRTLFIRYYEIGRDKGSVLDSRLAIALARLVLARAATPDESGAAGNDLGIALRTLGQRESGIVRLDQAVTAYTKALKEFTRDRVPLDWAMTQMNLGTALLRLGERESGTVRLDQAVTAYTEALKEFTRDGVPLDWAMTQMNFGNALATLGARESGTARLDQAVTAYTEALKVFTRDRIPMQWAITQLNLSRVELAFFYKTSDTVHLDRAKGYANAAREVFVEAQASQYIMMTDQQLANIQSRRS